MAKVRILTSFGANVPTGEKDEDGNALYRPVQHYRGAVVELSDAEAVKAVETGAAEYVTKIARWLGEILSGGEDANSGN